jgi:hypothetical protein
VIKQSVNWHADNDIDSVVKEMTFLMKTGWGWCCWVTWSINFVRNRTVSGSVGWKLWLGLLCDVVCRI